MLLLELLEPEFELLLEPEFELLDVVGLVTLDEPEELLWLAESSGFVLPEFELPDPELELPEFDPPELELPELELPEFEPEFELPEPLLPDDPPRSSAHTRLVAPKLKAARATTAFAVREILNMLMCTPFRISGPY